MRKINGHDVVSWLENGRVYMNVDGCWWRHISPQMANEIETSLLDFPREGREESQFSRPFNRFVKTIMAMELGLTA